MILFFSLLFVAVAIAGFCAFVIFWPLSLVHIRDRHPALADRFGVVDRTQIGVSPVPLVEAVFPLDHHAQVLVIE